MRSYVRTALTHPLEHRHSVDSPRRQRVPFSYLCRIQTVPLSLVALKNSCSLSHRTSGECPVGRSVTLVERAEDSVDGSVFTSSPALLDRIQSGCIRWWSHASAVLTGRQVSDGRRQEGRRTLEMAIRNSRNSLHRVRAKCSAHSAVTYSSNRGTSRLPPSVIAPSTHVQPRRTGRSADGRRFFENIAERASTTERRRPRQSAVGAHLFQLILFLFGEFAWCP